MRRAAILPALLVAAIALVLAGRAPGAWACSCLAPGTYDPVKAADAIFTGMVTSLQDLDPEDINDSIRVAFDVESVAKGTVGDPEVVETAGNGALCGYAFVTGHRYKVFANGEPRSYSVNMCSATEDLGPAKAPRTLKSRAPAPSPSFLPRTTGGVVQPAKEPVAVAPPAVPPVSVASRDSTKPAAGVGAGALVTAVGVALVMTRRQRARR